MPPFLSENENEYANDDYGKPIEECQPDVLCTKVGDREFGHLISVLG